MIENMAVRYPVKIRTLSLIVLCINSHKWFSQDKTMTQSEEKAHEKFTLTYYVRDSENNSPQKNLLSCLQFATEAHKDQKRKDMEKTPYINHPIGVAYILAEEAKMTNLNLLRGCLLHDTVEDTPVTSEMVRAKFGDFIGDLVDEVTDDKTLPKQKRKDLQVIHARTTSPQGKLVKLADKLYNLRDLEKALPEGWTEDRRNEYFLWAFQVCEGLRGVSPMLEEKLDEIFTKRGLISAREQSDALFLPPWPNNDQLASLIAAANFAAVKHRRHFVFDDSNNAPYINHLVSTSFILSQEADIEDISILCAALLSDTVGKTETSLEEVEKQFGKEVRSLVEELTFDHSLPVLDQLNIQIEKAQSLSRSGKLITLAKLADLCRRLEVCRPAAWAEAECEEYFHLSRRLSEELAGTHPRLEQDLSHVWVGQGLKEFPMKSKEGPHDL